MGLDRLAKVLSAEGPFVSLYVDTTSAVEDAATRLETRGKNISAPTFSRTRPGRIPWSPQPQQRGRDELACDGPAAVVAALRMSQVDTLLVTDALDQAAAPAWFGPEPTHLALTEAGLRDLRVPGIETAPLVDVLLRAALGTAADVRLVTGSVEQAPRTGIGALLRFPSQST